MMGSYCLIAVSSHAGALILLQATVCLLDLCLVYALLCVFILIQLYKVQHITVY